MTGEEGSLDVFGEETERAAAAVGVIVWRALTGECHHPEEGDNITHRVSHSHSPTSPSLLISSWSGRFGPQQTLRVSPEKLLVTDLILKEK